MCIKVPPNPLMTHTPRFPFAYLHAHELRSQNPPAGHKSSTNRPASQRPSIPGSHLTHPTSSLTSLFFILSISISPFPPLTPSRSTKSYTSRHTRVVSGPANASARIGFAMSSFAAGMRERRMATRCRRRVERRGVCAVVAEENLG